MKHFLAIDLHKNTAYNVGDRQTSLSSITSAILGGWGVLALADFADAGGVGGLNFRKTC